MILVDTNIWSELARPKPHRGLLQWIGKNRHQFWLSSVVLAEILSGVALMPAGKRREDIAQRVKALVENYADRILVFDEHGAARYAEILRLSKDAGKPIQMADAMIAATALSLNMRIATRNVKDFEGLGLELINPWEDKG